MGGRLIVVVPGSGKVNEPPEKPLIMQTMTEAPERITRSLTNDRSKTLPAVFINRQGEPEVASPPATAGIFQMDVEPFSDRIEACPLSMLTEQLENAAMNRLRRALFETGQLIVTTEDGVSRVCFAGVGDPERLFVEMMPRDEPVPLHDFDSPGRLCLLPHAEAILRRIYRGESSEKLAGFLGGRAAGYRHDPEAA